LHLWSCMYIFVSQIIDLKLFSSAVLVTNMNIILFSAGKKCILLNSGHNPVINVCFPMIKHFVLTCYGNMNSIILQATQIKSTSHQGGWNLTCNEHKTIKWTFNFTRHITKIKSIPPQTDFYMYATLSLELPSFYFFSYIYWLITMYTKSARHKNEHINVRFYITNDNFLPNMK